MHVHVESDGHGQLLTPERWLRDFELLDVKPEVRPKILKHNAARLLGLGVDRFTHPPPPPPPRRSHLSGHNCAVG